MSDKQIIAALRRALKPFAKEAAQWSDSVSDSYRPAVTEPQQQQFHARAEFNIGHLRRAKKLIYGAAP
jgi:hypothetical protein